MRLRLYRLATIVGIPPSTRGRCSATPDVPLMLGILRVRNRYTEKSNRQGQGGYLLVIGLDGHTQVRHMGTVLEAYCSNNLNLNICNASLSCTQNKETAHHISISSYCGIAHCSHIRPRCYVIPTRSRFAWQSEAQCFGSPKSRIS